MSRRERGEAFEQALLEHLRANGWPDAQRLPGGFGERSTSYAELLHRVNLLRHAAQEADLVLAQAEEHLRSADLDKEKVIDLDYLRLTEQLMTQAKMAATGLVDDLIGEEEQA